MGLANGGEGDATGITASISLPDGLAFSTPASGSGALAVAPRESLATYMRFALDGSFSIGAWNCTLSSDAVTATCDLPELGAGTETSLDLDLLVGDGDLAPDAETSFSVTSGDQTVTYAVRTGLEDNEENIRVTYATEGQVAAIHVGATLLGCDETITGCSNVMKFVGSSSDSKYNNNNWDMQPLNEAGGATNSASTLLNLPVGSTVKYALLEWSANRGASDTFAGDQSSARLMAPGDTEYADIAADSVDEITDGSGRVYYRARVDVTDLVDAAGSGTWSLADIALPETMADTDKTYYAGFALTVIYEDPSLSNSRVAIFDGAQWITSDQAADVEFATSANAEVTVGWTAWEGDRALVGDRLEIDGDSFRPRRWNGTNSPADGDSNSAADSTAFGGKHANTLGVDAKLFHAAGVAEGVHTVKVSTAGDNFLLSTLTITIADES